MLRVGMNPYGFAYAMGLHGRGTPRANPAPLSLTDYLDLAAQLGLTGVEIPTGMIAPLDEAGRAKVRERIAANKWWVVLSEGPPAGKIERTIECAKALGAPTVRMALTTVLCGDRAEKGAEWAQIVAGVKKSLPEAAKRLAEHGVAIAIENHQDFGSAELLELCDLAGANVGVCLDCGNALAVGEEPLAFARAVAARVRHVHLKDYRAHWSDEGYRLVRCAIGDGCVPFKEIAKILERREALPASIEPGALNARHVRLLTQRWWEGYAPRAARELAAALAVARARRMREDEDWRTPWEAEGDAKAIVDYEMAQLRKSAANMKELGLL